MTRKSSDIIKDGLCTDHGKLWMLCEECEREYKDAESKEWLQKQRDIKECYEEWHRNDINGGMLQGRILRLNE